MVQRLLLKLRIFSVPVSYLACVATLYCIGVYGDFFVAPTSANVVYWDGSWYNEIRQIGYVENTPMGKYASCAFYPLFPLVWKWSGLGTMGILLLNGSLFMLSVSVLFHHFRADIWQSLLLLSIPMLLFCFLPYTEALSFCLLSFFLLFLHKKAYVWAMVFLLLAGWTRPLIWQIVPLVVTWVILDFKKLKDQKFVVPVLILGTGLFSFLTMNMYQYWQTGVWNANVKAYSYWGGHFQIPTLPLRTFETPLAGVWIRQIDFVAFAVCLLGLFYLAWFFYKVYFGKRELGGFQLLLAMSCAYMASMMLIRLLTMKGDFWSLSRYIFVNPFFVFFLFFSLRLTLSKFWICMNIGFLFLSQTLFAKQGHLANWATFGWADLAFVGISSNLRYFGITKKYFYALLILLGMFIQCYLLHCYLLNGEWVG